MKWHERGWKDITSDFFFLFTKFWADQHSPSLSTSVAENLVLVWIQGWKRWLMISREHSTNMVPLPSLFALYAVARENIKCYTSGWKSYFHFSIKFHIQRGNPAFKVCFHSKLAQKLDFYNYQWKEHSLQFFKIWTA